MKTLSIAAISDASQMPLKKGTLQFLQDAHKETMASSWKALIGPQYSPAVVYVIGGGVNTGQAPNYIISAGAVFFNGEIFDFDDANFTATSPNVAVFNIIQSQFTVDADPVIFTDKTVRNIHNIRKVQIAQGASGSGIADLSQGYYLSFAIPPAINLTATGAASISGTFPNQVINVPVQNSMNPVIYAGSFNVGDVMGSSSGGSAFQVNFSTPLNTAAYYVMGSVVSNGNPNVDSILTWSFHSRTATGFILNLQEWTTGIQNIAFEFLIFAK